MKNVFSPARGAEEHHPGERPQDGGFTPQSPELPPPEVAGGRSPRAEEGRSREGRGAKDRQTERERWRRKGRETARDSQGGQEK